MFSGADGKTFIALQLSKRMVSLPFGWLLKRLPNEEVRRELLQGLAENVGSTRTQNLTGYPAFEVGRLADPDVAARFSVWLRSAINTMR